MNVNQEIDRLRSEESSPQAKGELILKLQHKQERKRMKLFSRLGLPTALVAGGIIAVVTLLPKTALASPETVAKALRDARNYVISSFTIESGKRSLQAKTYVHDGQKTRTTFDANGKALPANEVKDPITMITDGAMADLALEDSPGGHGTIMLRTGGPGSGAEANTKHSVEMHATKGADGTKHETIIVDGKKVDKLPEGMSAKDGNGPTFSAGSETEGAVNIVVGDGDGSQRSAAVVGINNNGKFSTFVSGQTAVDYLVQLLDDESRWTIERGVNVNGARLDKFTLKGPESPIELFVDPGTSLPRLLRFVDMGKSGTVIEDTYDYTAAPTK